MSSIGFIGTGNMGSALIKGLAGKGVTVAGSDLDQAKLKTLADQYGLTPKTDPKALVNDCDIVVIAVKPQQIADLFKEAASTLTDKKILVSIAAGVTLEGLRALAGDACALVRVMPNTPALVNAGVTAVCFDPDSTFAPETRDEVMNIFSSVGAAYEMPEKNFDAFTALVGSGPAYVFYFMEAAIEAGVNLGLTRDLCQELVMGLFSGSSKLAAETDFGPGKLREMVTSPAGTTIKGLHVLDSMAVRATIMDAVEAAYERSLELGK